MRQQPRGIVGRRMLAACLWKTPPPYPSTSSSFLWPHRCTRYTWGVQTTPVVSTDFWWPAGCLEKRFYCGHFVISSNRRYLYLFTMRWQHSVLTLSNCPAVHGTVRRKDNAAAAAESHLSVKKKKVNVVWSYFFPVDSALHLSFFNSSIFWARFNRWFYLAFVCGVVELAHSGICMRPSKPPTVQRILGEIPAKTQCKLGGIFRRKLPNLATTCQELSWQHPCTQAQCPLKVLQKKESLVPEINFFFGPQCKIRSFKLYCGSNQTFLFYIYFVIFQLWSVIDIAITTMRMQPMSRRTYQQQGRG